MTFLGIDVSKATLDAAAILETGEVEQQRFANDASGHAQLIEWMTAFPDHCCVMEATGSYHRRLCRVMRVSKSGFLAWRKRKPSRRALEDAALSELIRVIHAENLEVYGAPRIHIELREEHGVRVGRKRVARLMRDLGLTGCA